MDPLSPPPPSPVIQVATIATPGQIPSVYRLTMLHEAVAYVAFAILWLFGYARVRPSPSKFLPSPVFPRFLLAFSMLTRSL